MPAGFIALNGKDQLPVLVFHLLNDLRDSLFKLAVANLRVQIKDLDLSLGLSLQKTFPERLREGESEVGAVLRVDDVQGAVGGEAVIVKLDGQRAAAGNILVEWRIEDPAFEDTGWYPLAGGQNTRIRLFRRIPLEGEIQHWIIKAERSNNAFSEKILVVVFDLQFQVVYQRHANGVSQGKLHNRSFPPYALFVRFWLTATDQSRRRLFWFLNGSSRRWIILGHSPAKKERKTGCRQQKVER